ncbi:MAG TPA: hypothetical protein PLI66_09860 [Spirochaetales bacterium]|nr:hypothetical protein [Spirochaetales bacterium]
MTELTAVQLARLAPRLDFDQLTTYTPHANRAAAEWRIAERPERLPDLRSAGWLFRRSYRYRADGLVEFDTELSRLDGVGVPSGDPSGADRGSTTLTPFTVDELLEAASEAGLEARGAYSSWARQPFEPSSSMVALLELVRT